LLTRREFASCLGSSLALAAIAPLPAFGNSASDLYGHAFVFDANCLASVGQTPPIEQQALMNAIRDSGVTIIKSTLGGGNGTFDQALADIADIEQLIELWPDYLMTVRTASDMNAAQQSRKLGLIYSFEAASMHEGKLERIALFRRLGVRIMQLTYNRRTPFGVGCLEGDAGGLTGLGRQAIASMNQLGVAVDLSHSNTQTTREAIAACAKPPIFTHTGCRSVYNHPRSKEDQDMKALADKGGVMGIYMLPFLTASPRQPMLDDYLRHMEYALKICGEDHVGIGSDTSLETVTPSDIEATRKEVEERKAAGISAPGEDRTPYIPDINTPRKLELVADALLRRGHSPAAVEKILGANFRRVLTEIWNSPA